MQLDEAVFAGMLRHHLTTYPLSIRFFTSDIIFALTMAGLTIKQAYFLIQYSLVVLLAFVFYRYLLALGFTKRNSNFGLFLLLSAYPILAAHIEPVHTWDDIWCHLFLALSMTAFIKDRPASGLVWFTLACFAREQSLIFLPIAVYAYRTFTRERSHYSLIGVIAMPIIFYGAYYAFHWQSPGAERFSLIAYNFANPLRTSDTLFSLFISFGLLWVTALIGLFCRRTSPVFRFLFAGTLITVPATLVIALFLACARETRLLFPPFLFIIPLSVIVLKTVYDRISDGLTSRSMLATMLIIVALMTVGVILGNIAFPEFEYRRCPNFQRLWAGIHFGLILSLIAYGIRWGWKGFFSDRRDNESYFGSREL